MPAPPLLPQSSWTRRTASHLLSRGAFSGTPEEHEAFYQLGNTSGVAAAVDSLINQTADLSANPLPSWLEGFSNGDFEGDAELPYLYRESTLIGWFYQQCRHGAPVAAKMWKFWIDHFPVQIATSPFDTRFVVYSRYLDLLRQNAVGNFDTLLREVSWSEGMMAMLDLQQSQKGRVNENFGRELLELFTLGVEGGYTESDVQAAADAFTGRRFRSNPPYTNFRHEAYLDNQIGLWDAETSTWHPEQYTYIDESEKTLLGETLPSLERTLPGDPRITRGDPNEHGELAITIILNQPQTARYLVEKIWRYFASPEIPPTILADLADRFRNDHNYEITPLLRDIFLSAAFYAPEAIGTQIKDPVDLIISSQKMLGAADTGIATTSELFEELGYVLYAPPNIAGWPEPDGEGNQWLSTGSMMFRLNLHSLFTHGERSLFQRSWRIPDASDAPYSSEFPFPDFIDLNALIPKVVRDPKDAALLIDHLNDRLLPFHRLRPDQRRSLIQHIRRTRSGSDLEGVYREVIRQIASLPEFQMQ